MRAWIGSALLLCLLCACEQSSSPTTGTGTTSQPATSGGGGARVKIAVIPKGTTHDFWKSVHAGAVKAARELGNVELVFRGPEREDDREQQVSLVQNFISSRVGAIVLAPLDERALLPAVQQAMAAKIPVVIIDSGLAGKVGEDFVSFAATDNHKGGQLGAQRMGEVLQGKGNVLLLRYQEGSESTAERERGFVEGLKEFPEITLIDPQRYAGPTRATAQEAAENLLTANRDIQGVFCPNESSTFGMLLALRSRGLTHQVHFVGFDASPGLVEALGAKELDGLVVQDPLRMGYMGVKSAAAALAGETVPPRQDTGVVLVTPDTMNEPAYKELLTPDLKKYLD